MAGQVLFNQVGAATNSTAVLLGRQSFCNVDCRPSTWDHFCSVLTSIRVVNSKNAGKALYKWCANVLFTAPLPRRPVDLAEWPQAVSASFCCLASCTLLGLRPAKM